ncbi:hypothetical protein ACSNOD_16265, partial [Streptomyces sp. URMC 123]
MARTARPATPAAALLTLLAALAALFLAAPKAAPIATSTSRAALLAAPVAASHTAPVAAPHTAPAPVADGDRAPRCDRFPGGHHTEPAVPARAAGPSYEHGQAPATRPV